MYRLMKQMHLPKMSTVKPPKPASKIKENGLCSNLLAQQFDQKAPNLVWVCDFTYVRVGKRFYYICAILDLYARKVIACRVGSKIDRFLAIDTLRDAVHIEACQQASCSTQTEVPNLLPPIFARSWTGCIWSNLFLPKGILMTMPLWSVSSNT